MNCERCETVVLLGLAGEADGDELDEARRHAAGCPRCRETTARDVEVWSELSGWEVPTAPAGAAERLRTRLALETALARSETPRRWAPLVAAALVGVIVGIALPSRTAPPETVDEREATFLLLLRRGPEAVEPAAGPERDRMIVRYAGWREALSRRGALRLSRLLDAGTAIELRRRLDGVTAERIAPRDRGEYVSGLFLVEADDLAAAEAIARSSPHLDYGGSIEVRAVVTPPEPSGR